MDIFLGDSTYLVRTRSAESVIATSRLAISVSKPYFGAVLGNRGCHLQTSLHEAESRSRWLALARHRKPWPIISAPHLSLAPGRSMFGIDSHCVCIRRFYSRDWFRRRTSALSTSSMTRVYRPHKRRDRMFSSADMSNGKILISVPSFRKISN